MKISIVTPSYNQAEYLERTIDSVLSQGYNDLEYIIIDGGSSDGSVSIIKKYEKYLTYWSSSPDRGQTDAICKGFDKATGEIFGWLNSDDIYFPGCLKNVSDTFSSSIDCDLLLGGLAYVDENDQTFKIKRYVSPIQMFAKCGLIAFGQQSLFFTRQHYEKLGGLKRDLHYVMDSDFVHRSVRSGANFSVNKQILAGFRWHGKMKSTDGSNVKKNELTALYQSYSPYKNFYNVARYLYILQNTLNLSYLKDYKLCKEFQKGKINE